MDAIPTRRDKHICPKENNALKNAKLVNYSINRSTCPDGPRLLYLP